MKSPFRNIYINNRLFWIIGVIAAFFAISFSVDILFYVAQAVIFIAIILVMVDAFLLFNSRSKLSATRKTSNALSLSDENNVHIIVRSKSPIPLQLHIIDELPYQLQKRDFAVDMKIANGQFLQIDYQVRPVIRGAYTFKNINIYAKSAIGLISRRYTFNDHLTVPVYPSLIQMKEYELKTLSRISFFEGVKKMRRIGHSYEFEQIKKYVRGDDVRSINWKATSRVGELMVNHILVNHHLFGNKQG